MSTTFVAAPGLEAAPLADGGAVLYSSKTGKFVMLNRVADQLWSELTHGRTEDELVRGLCTTYPEIEIATARDAVRQTLESLRGLNLVKQAEDGERHVSTPVATETDSRGEYVSPIVNMLAEDDLLKVFQMTAAEISVAGCWWGGCITGNP